MYIGKTEVLVAVFTATLLSLSVAQAAPKSKAKHLNQLSCAAGEVAKFDGANWVCAKDIGADLTAAMECAAGEVLLGNGSCTDLRFLIPSTERFVDNGDGTITDNDTGLMWEKKDAADGVSDLSNPHDADNRYSWTSTADGDNTNPDGTAFTDFLPTLNQEATDNPDSTCFANHCDWRVPRLPELRSILLEQFACSTSPCIDPIFYPTAATNYWSSTSAATGPDFAWFVFFSDGGVFFGSKDGVGLVRAVRGGR